MYDLILTKFSYKIIDLWLQVLTFTNIHKLTKESAIRIPYDTVNRYDRIFS